MNDYNKFVDYVHGNLDEKAQNQTLKSGQIVLVPSGKKGGLKKGIVISADNSLYFTMSELLWKAKEIQESLNEEKSEGIGIYRLGFEKRIPSYSIGEFTNEYVSTLKIH